jgi:two-component system, chemotaxis family, CheB/CheR fusion protein
MAKTGASQIVVIGSSAGGIDALSVLVSRLEPEFPAPIVIAQHLDPRRRSHLPEILANRTTLPVKSVDDSERLQAGVIYLVPANRDVEITDHMVRVQEHSTTRGPKPSVDRLLETAAASFGEHLIAVILSGEGSDGAEGARSVKLAGGTVIIQDPSTAAHPSMPQSLAPTTVDIVAPLESIAGLLRDLLAGVRVQEPEDGATLDRFLRQVRDQTGIDFASYKRPTITRRLHRRMAAVGATTLNDYIRFVSRNPTEYDRLASGFLIKVTEFFRDSDLFTYLRNEVVPRIIKFADEREREIRVWSAGCATGEEAYSLSILLAEALGESLAQYNVRVFATDLDADAVNFARRGIYSRSAVASMAPELVDRYFQRIGDEYEIRKNIRSLTVFGQHDLAQRAPFPRIDLAVTRNVLIYFTPELQKRALQLFAFSLREGGTLVLGKAESVGQLPEYFVTEEPRLKVYRRHGERVLIPPSRGGAWMREAVGLPPRSPATRAPHAALATLDTRAARNERPTIAEKSEQILLRLPIGVVLVDGAYDIQLINGSARQALEIHGTAVDRDFVHLASVVPSQPLRDGIDKAIAGSNGTIEVQRDDPTGNGARTLRLTFEGHRMEPNALVPDSVLVIIEDLTTVKARFAELEVRGSASAAEAATLNRRAELLAETNEELLSANHELTLANAELRSANEELLVGSEEVQAATEEVETLNEELQATNEELETLNEELQATVEELNTTNDDLEARSAEVERAAAAVREEQDEHAEAIRSIAERLLSDHDGVAVITADGRVLGSSELAAALRGDGVRPIGDAPPVRGEGSLIERVGRGEGATGIYELTLGGVQGRYEFATEPLSRDGAAAGAVITVRAASGRGGRGKAAR